MDYYYLDKNTQSTGYHEVHKSDCEYLPTTSNREYLGYFSDCYEATDKALEKFDDIDGCKFCLPECNPNNE